MAQRTFNDGTSGDVVIRPGPPASSGGGTGGGGGGFGGNRVGASGAFSGLSQSKKDARRRVKQEYLQAQEQKRLQAAAEAAQAQAAAIQAQAHAHDQARAQARQQSLAELVQRHSTFRTGVDQSFAARTAQLGPSLEHEISKARRPPDSSPSERWQLYFISKEKNEIDGLISRKTAELNAKSEAVRSFDGHDPLTRTTSDYLTRLQQFGEALNDGHQIWENAYNAAHEARLLTAQINALTGKSSALAGHHAEQTVVWREREAVWEAQRQYAEQREARIRFRRQADEDTRIERVRQANTLTVPITSVAVGGMVLTPEGVRVAQEIAAVLEKAIESAVDSLTDIGRIAARTGPVFVTAMVYSPTLGNGELTLE